MFQKNAYSVSINREEQITGYVAEASEVLSFKGEPVLTEKALNEILRKIMCAGGNLTELRADIVFAGGFEEAELRKFSSSLKKLADKIEVQIKKVSVYLRESAEPGKTVFISGKGCLKKTSDAPWQRQRIFEGQKIILTGSVGKSGMIELFDKNKQDLKQIYPDIYIEKMSNKSADRQRLPRFIRSVLCFLWDREVLWRGCGISEREKKQDLSYMLTGLITNRKP